MNVSQQHPFVPFGQRRGIVDPRSTRRRVTRELFERNSALYAQYEVVGAEGAFVVLQRRAEFCRGGC